MSIRKALNYINLHAKEVQVNNIRFVEKSHIIAAFEFAAQFESFKFELVKPLTSGYYLVKEYNKSFTRVAKYDSKTETFSSNNFVLDIEKWARIPEL